MSLELINPFEDVIIFDKDDNRGFRSAVDKRYKVAVPVPSSTVIRAITPTGRHVSHANRLGHWSGPHSGGKATRLERYTGGHGGSKKGIHVGKSLAGGFEALGRIPKVKKVPFSAKSGLEDRLKNGPIPKPSAASATPDAQPSVFSLKRTSGKAIAGGTAGAVGLGAYGLHRHNSYERGQGALASKALAPVTPPAVTALKPTKPLLAKSPITASAPTSKLNSNMPAGARVGKRIPPDDVAKREEWATYGRRAVQAVRGRGSSTPSAGEKKRGVKGRAKWMAGGVPDAASYTKWRAGQALKNRRRQ